MKQTKSNWGCGALIVAAIAISLLVTYWYVFVALAVLGAATWYYVHQKQVKAQAAAAEEARQAAATAKREAAEQTKVEQIRRFKALLDDGAITQAEYDQQKARILGDGQDPLDF
ncbi:SHOCT domain-containing protein [Lacticaseibacillus suihuaensis]